MAFPILAPADTWYTQGGTTVKRASITKIEIKDSYTPTGTVTASWDASAAKDGSIMVYVEGTKLTLAGNGSGSISLSADASWTFSESGKSDYFTSLCIVMGADILDTSGVTTMERMFQGCESLTTVDVGNWNTASVQSMKAMFQFAHSLAALDVSLWDVSGVVDMGGMFNMSADPGNRTLITLDVSKWDVSKVTGFALLFESCFGLTILDVSSWDVSQAADMHGMFGNCYSLASLDLSKWNTLNCANMHDMFAATHSLEKITIGSNFSFNGNGASTAAVLMVPGDGYIEGTDGNWYDIDKTPYIPADIPSRTTRTYYASKALAEADDNRYVLVKNGTLMRTAAAIRTAKGTQDMYTPSEFAAAIVT